MPAAPAYDDFALIVMPRSFIMMITGYRPKAPLEISHFSILPFEAIMTSPQGAAIFVSEDLLDSATLPRHTGQEAVLPDSSTGGDD